MAAAAGSTGARESRARTRVRRGLIAWALLSVIGVGIVLVPDAGPRVLVLSEGHGPSAGDLVGVVILLLGWVAMLVPLLRARHLVPAPRIVLTVVLVGIAIVLWSVLLDVGAWWVGGTALAAGAQLFAAGAVARPARIKGPGANRGPSSHRG